MDPSYDNSFGSQNPGGQTPTPDGNFTDQPVTPVQPAQSTQSAPQTLPMQSASPMPQSTQPMPQPTQPMPQSQPIYPSGQGDIILGGSKPKKSKKKLLIIALIVGILVVAAIVAAVVVVANRPNNQKSSQTIDRAFNRYYNYYMFDNDSTEKSDNDIEELSQTAFSQKASEEDIENRNNYYSNLRNYFKDFYNLYSVEVQDDEDIINFLNDYNKKLELMTYYYGGYNLDRLTILEAYIANGEQGAEELIKTTLSPYENIGEIYSMNYYELSKNYANIDKELIKNYISMNCVSEEDIDYLCASQNPNEEIESLKSEESMLYSDIRAILLNSRKDLFNNIFSIKNLIEDDENSGEQDD